MTQIFTASSPLQRSRKFTYSIDPTYASETGNGRKYLVRQSCNGNAG